MFVVKDPVWEMEPEEELFLLQLPEVMELWRARSESVVEDGIYYLSRDRGMDGQRAMSHSHVTVRVECIAVRSEFILAVDLDRQTAQVVQLDWDGYCP